MAWPSDDLVNDELDQGTDDPALARTQLNNLLLKVQAMLAAINAGATVWDSASDGPGTGLNADLLDDSELTAVLDRANHTGTQLLSTISDPESITVDNSNWSGTDLSVANGGTGSSAANGARENLTIYHGRVTSAGASIRLPSGWSVVKDSTGIYTLTHNLGVTSYSMVITCDAAVSPRLTNHTSTSIQYRTHLMTDASAADAGIDFMLIVD